MPLADDLLRALAALSVAARRLYLTTPGVAATVPMLRGVWGAALHAEDRDAYERVFVGGEPASRRVPAYLLRPAAGTVADPPALDWIVFNGARACEAALHNAWQRAAAMGLGPDRRPFAIRQIEWLGPRSAAAAGPWHAGKVRWPGSPDAPCRLVFPAPLRLLARKRLILAPTLADLTEHALRRLAALMGAEGSALVALAPVCRGAAEAVGNGTWEGRPLDLVRYSAAQKQEVELRGITGALFLPRGPGPLWPLLAAAQWSHIGKGTVFGLGQVEIEPTTCA